MDPGGCPLTLDVRQWNLAAQSVTRISVVDPGGPPTVSRDKLVDSGGSTLSPEVK